MTKPLSFFLMVSGTVWYFVFSQNPEMFLVGMLGIFMAGISLCNLIYDTIPTDVKTNDWLLPLIVVIALVALKVFLDNAGFTAASSTILSLAHGGLLLIALAFMARISILAKRMTGRI